MYKIIILLITFLLFCNVIDTFSKEEYDQELAPYVNALKEQGENPFDFVIKKIEDYNLIIFDDALHPAKDPFVFYQELIKKPEFHKTVKYIFVEAIPLNQQPHIEEYLTTEPEDIRLLYPAFQNDHSALGLNFQTYFDLLHTVYQVNQQLPEEDQLKVVGVSPPTYWSEINTYRDLELFRQSLKTFDYAMYQNILSEMDHFSADAKGIFLTNTRHAYKGIKDKQGDFFWNCGTFFHQWHPGNTYSIRFHNVNLYIEKAKVVEDSTVKTTQGLERIEYKWVRMADGLWDSAYKIYGNKSVAVPLKDTPFGNEAYIGNHMLHSAPDQTMYDAYDAIIFLKPLEELRWTAKTDKIYTDEYKNELIRRHKIMYTAQQLQKEMKEYDVKTIEALVEKKCRSEPEKPLPLLENIGPIDEWKTE